MYLGIISFLVLFSVLDIQNVFASDDPPVVVTSVGTIRGVKASDGNYSMFMGIPYATVNASTPFGPSSANLKFEGVFDANDDSVVCPQIEEFNNTIVGSIDCLNLNVYVPDSASIQNPVAVLIWIYGGGYATGFASRFVHGPKYFLRHDIILVTFNYRLGPYGFMCLHRPGVPGNQGLKDQLTALRWVRNNIAAFGGDVNRITLFGESAGAVSVDLHVVSEQEKLYNSVIMQSGNSFNPRSMRIPVITAPIAIASKFGFQTDNVDEALTYISNVNHHDIIAAACETGIVFRPCAEKNFDNVERLVKDFTINIDKVPKAKNMPVLLGFNDDELKINFALIPPIGLQYLNEFSERLNVSFTFNNEMFEEIERMVRNFYIGDEEYSEAVIQELSDFASDFQYINPAQRGLKNYLKNGAKEVFYYVFSYSGHRNFVKRRFGLVDGGAFHADEIGYMFDMEIFPEDPTDDDQLMIDRLTTMWTNFAKYGDPTPETTTLLPVKWTPVTKNSEYHFMNISLEMDLGTRPFRQRLAFWDLFYKTYGEYELHYQKNGQWSLNGNILSHVILITSFCLEILLFIR